MKLTYERVIETMRRHKLLFFSMIFATLMIGVLVGTMINRSVNADKLGGAPGATALAIPSPAQLSSEFSKVAKLVEPAVVNINTETIIKNQSQRRYHQYQGDPEEDPFDFFQRFFGMPGPMQAPEEQKSQALGSGFIVDKAGYIVTNFHVVDRADSINIKLSTGDEYKAKVIGKDEKTDIAVIKIEAKKDLPFLKMGNSDSMNVGDWVLAIGSPFGLEQTVTAGIISAKGRPNPIGQFQRFLQTDAAINPGNSGGPLVNLAGEVIGVNTSIVTPTRGFSGIGLALPSNTAATIYNQLIKTGKVTRGAIGISMQTEVNSRTLKALGSPDGKGVLVIGFSGSDSPAIKAGLKEGDIITEIDGKKVNDYSELTSLVADLSPGKTISVKYLRDSKENTTQLTVADRKNVIQEDGDARTADSDEGEQVAKLGLGVRSLTSEDARRFEMKTSEGALVSRVQPGSVADDAGIRPGDMIVEVNKKPVRNPEEYASIAGRLKSGEDVLFLVKRYFAQSPTNKVQTLYMAAQIP